MSTEARAEVEAAAEGDGRLQRWQERLEQAALDYDRERYWEARRLLAPLAVRFNGVGAVRELYGLTLYRLSRWRAAIAELEAAERLSRSVDQHPVLADCYRALGRHAEVERLWDDMRQAGVGVAAMVEGRIVLAGSKADRGDVQGAIEILERGPMKVRRPQQHHLRLWYALAALYERAGNIPRARDLFAAVVDFDPAFADASTRLDAFS